MSTHSLGNDAHDLQTRLIEAAGDTSPAAAIVSRAAAQGRRSLRRRRAVWTAGAGLSVAVATTLAVSGTWRNEPTAQTIAPAGPGTVRTVPDQRPAPVRDNAFVVDPQVQQAASDAFNAAAAATLPAVSSAPAQPGSITEGPLSTGQRGWAWVSTDETTTPAMTVFVTVDPGKKQPIPAVSICHGTDMAMCTDEVLPDGTHLVSGSVRTTSDQDGVTSEWALPFATATRPDGRVIDARTMSAGPLQDAESDLGHATVTADALRHLVATTSLAELALPKAAGS